MSMRPTFMGFETAKTSIFYNQKNLDIVANNLANATTAGYTRQRVNAGALYVNSTDNRIAVSQIGLAGQGVETTGVSQMRDSFLDKCFRDQYATASYYTQTATTLTNIQTALVDAGDVTDEDGLLGAIQRIFESIQDYTADPTTGTEANIVKSAFTNLTQMLKQIDVNLTQVAEEETFKLSANVDRVNEILDRLTNINKEISESAVNLLDPDNGYFKPNELLDQRNLLVDELAGYVDLNVTEYLDGTCDVTIGGVKAVNTETGKPSYFRLQQNDDATVSLKWLANGENIQLTGGALLAQEQYISGRGANIQSNTEAPQQGILYYRDCINTFAKAITDIANNSIPETTTDSLGNVVMVNDKFAYSTQQLSNKIAGKATIDYDLPQVTDTISMSIKVGDGSYKTFTYSGTTANPATLGNVMDSFDTWLGQNFGTTGSTNNIEFDRTTNTLKINNGQEVTIAGVANGRQKNNLAYQLGLLTTINKSTSNIATAGNTLYDLGLTDLADEIAAASGGTATANGITIQDYIDGNYGNNTLTVDGQTLTVGFDDGKFTLTGNAGTYDLSGFAAAGDVTQHLAALFGSSAKIGSGDIVYKKLLGAKVDGSTNNSTSITAANIALSDEWENGGADYFIFSSDENIAKYAQSLCTKLTSQDYTFNSFGESFTGTFEEFVTNYSGKVGTDISYSEGRSETASRIADSYLDQRDEVSGVVENEETSNMLQFQRAFQAASRVMTTMDDFLDKIINSMGRVGL